MTGEVVWRRLIGRGLLLAVVGLAASVLLLMAWSSMRSLGCGTTRVGRTAGPSGAVALSRQRGAGVYRTLVAR